MPHSKPSRSLLDHFSALEDPRQQWKVVYPLPEILLVILSATLAGADDFVEIAAWAEERIDFLRQFLPFDNGIPSHDTLNDVMNALDPTLFEACFVAWVQQLQDDDPDIVAIDGKTSRRAHDRHRGRAPLHTVSAWASRQRLVLGQQAVEEKSNEITAIPLLLEKLTLQGALVTIDAIGAQNDIAERILARGGDYLLALKANRPALHDEVARFFEDPPENAVSRFETTDSGHGRIEVRRHAVCHEVHWLFSDRRYPGEPALKGLAMIAMVESTVERDGKTLRSRRYYISSAPLDAETFARAVRAHWGVENRLHWVLDVIFHDDMMRLRKGFGAQNMAIVRHMAVNLLQATKPVASLKVRRKKAAWSTDYLKQVLMGTA